MISGFVLVSDAVWGCYPFKEAITSFLPALDELVVIVNPYSTDGTEQALRDAFGSDKRVRFVHSYFNIEEAGWKTYGIARTTGYQACHGDIVVMFDADGILHETDMPRLKTFLSALATDDSWHNAYWEKYRIFTPNFYWRQHKHSGIYNKKRMGDRFDFYADDGRGIPNWKMINETETERSLNSGIYIFGYEHTFDTEDVIRAKSARYGRMADRLHGREIQSDDAYYETYVNGLLASHTEKGEHSPMPIANHPSVIQKKLLEINESMFGFNMFGKTDAE